MENRASAIVRGRANLEQGENLTFAELRRCLRTICRSTVIGTSIGVIPGVGQVVAAFMGYAAAKSASSEPQKFGTGHIEGLTDASSANNGALGGAWVPALVFGIPGDSITAIVIGVLYLKGMNTA